MLVLAPHVSILKSIYRYWDHAIIRALTNSADAEDETDIDPNKAEFSDKAISPMQPPCNMTGKGKAPAQSATVLEMPTDSESDNSDTSNYRDHRIV